MKRTLMVVGVLLFSTFAFKRYSLSSKVTGTYILKNYNYEPFLAEIPYVADTLVLYPNGDFISSYWGKGTYEVSSNVLKPQIKLEYSYQYGKASFKTDIECNLFKRTQIVLFEMEDHYYERMD